MSTPTDQAPGAPELDVLGTPFPPYVGQDAEKRRRWNIAASAANDCSTALEPTGVPDRAWVWAATRSLYHSDTPTG